ncbi:metal-dependent hydrolase [Halobellus sp. H-GB7]|uniref:metal-dependent hydrolase n=1 Tax=Halobellus sp. H-GB7 TaxID=3069756 RepID=UPI0027ADFEC9|nr:metal-dependent hydrolase [Halobellus sp. H-GB7]MDQ2054438.1 metal-dependent hydrolase [Halobellus sp. H-GB7]
MATSRTDTSTTSRILFGGGLSALCEERPEQRAAEPELEGQGPTGADVTMWPWEHAAVGYLVYSIVVHVLRGRSPTGREAIVVALASQFPDVVDKPLSWELGIVSTGYGAAHSVLFAVPLSIGAVYVAHVYDRGHLGAAFAIGYLCHLPGDLLLGYLNQGRIPIENVLWPVRIADPVGETPEGGFITTFQEYLSGYVGEILAGTPETATLIGFITLTGCFVVWLLDGAPGVREVFGALTSH